MSSLHLERRYEFSPVIVWDALVDADLVVGWLAEATIRPELGGEYNLRRPNPRSSVSREGRITRFEPFTRLEVSSDDSGSLLFGLAEVVGGGRGTSTAMTVDIVSPIEPAFAATMRADWLTSLDQLDDLLRGHPVDWLHWERDRATTWSGHLEEAASDQRKNRPDSRLDPHG